MQHDTLEQRLAAIEAQLAVIEGYLVAQLDAENGLMSEPPWAGTIADAANAIRERLAGYRADWAREHTR